MIIEGYDETILRKRVVISYYYVFHQNVGRNVDFVGEQGVT